MVAPATMTRVGAMALTLLLGNVAALGTNYEHDSVTTYCWAIPRPTNMTKLTEADRTTVFSTRSQCPIVLTLSLPPSDTIRAFEAVNVTWTVQADFSGANAVNNTRLYFGPDKNGRSAQIVHSNVHSCVFGTGCDSFNDGKELVDKTVNKIANFSDNKATFTDTLQFPTPGEYSVLAHIILPNFNASSRFDYAVYAKMTVLAAAAPTAAPVTTAPIETTATPSAETSSSGSGLSQGATIAIIVGAVVVVAALAVIVVVLRRRRSDHHQNAGYTQAPVHEAGYVGGVRPSGAPGMKQSDMTDTNSTSGFQSAWGGNQNRPSGLDNTNQSSASSGSHSNQYSNNQYSNNQQYGAPPVARPSDMRAGSDMSQFTSSMHQPDMSASAYFDRASQPSTQGQRKKRVDSDVEL